MSGCDAVLRWGENRLIRTHWTLRSGRIEQRKCRLRVDSRHSSDCQQKTVSGSFLSFTEAGANGELAPIPAVHRTGRTEGLAAGSGYFADAPLIVPIDNLWWRVPITL